MVDEKVINNSKMVANQQAYNTDGVKDEEGNYIVQDGEKVHIGGAQYISIKEDGTKEFLKRKELLQSEKSISHTMIRTDKDSREDYTVPELQNQARNSNEVGYPGSSLNITSYNVYEKDGAQRMKPECVIVGVAGSSGVNKGFFGGTGNAPDWKENYDLSLNRSRYNGLSTAELERRANEVTTRTVNPPLSGVEVEVKEMHPDRAKMLYEVEIRQKVEGLKKYRDKGVPIILVGDSKGGEDAAYLALRSELSGVSIDRLYLTNPKGIRVSGDEHDETSDYGRLCKMAKEGKIIKEIVYPEILRNGIPQVDGGGNIGDGRLIPVFKTIYTVPKQVKDLTKNHTIFDYEDDVYQGFEGGYKFQCDQEPTVIREMNADDSGLGSGNGNIRGYRYVVSQVMDKSGKTMSVNDYFFEEQVKKLLKICTDINSRIKAIEEIKNEPILEYFTAEVDGNKRWCMWQHEMLISDATPFIAYFRDHKMLIEEQDLTEYELKNQYALALERHTEGESGKYKTVVINRVNQYIEEYKERVQSQIDSLKKYRNRIETEVIPSIHESHEKFKKSQEQITLIIEKMCKPERAGF